jgi:hypothetical protein
MFRLIRLFAPLLAIIALASAGVNTHAQQVVFKSFAVTDREPLRTLDARASGHYADSITLVYRFESHNAMARISRKEVETLVHRQRQVRLLFSPFGYSTFDFGNETDLVDKIMREAQSEPGGIDNAPKGSTLTISVSNGWLLVKRNIQGAVPFVFLYDGRRSYSRYGSAAPDVHSGFYYQALRGFVFPGFGLAGIPLVRDASHSQYFEMKCVTPGWRPPYGGRRNIEYWCNGSVEASDGDMDADGMPIYDRTVLCATRGGGDDHFTEARVTEHGEPVQLCTYSDYQPIGNGRTAPGDIRLTKACRLIDGLPKWARKSFEYHLVKTSDRALPASEFEIGTQSQNGPVVEGIPLDKQLTGVGARRSRIIEEANARPTYAMLAHALAFAAFGAWFVVRRREA